MNKAQINGVELEYEVSGSGEPVLLIPNGPFADSFLPLVSASALAQDHQLIRYHQRGQGGRGRSLAPVGFAAHASDAASLLGFLGIGPAHVVGHSTGAAIAMQLAADHPGAVRTLALLEPPLLAVPSSAAFLDSLGPALAAYGSGDCEGAMRLFLTVVSGLDRERWEPVLEQNLPGALPQAVRDADNFFGNVLPALAEWKYGADEAATVSVPVFAAVGADTLPLFADSHRLLQSWFPQVEESRVEGVGHLLHMQDPTALGDRLLRFISQHRQPEPGVSPYRPLAGNRR